MAARALLCTLGLLALRAPAGALAVTAALIGLAALLGGGSAVRRHRSRAQRRYVRLQVLPYRGDSAEAEAVLAMFEALHKRLLVRWWRRLSTGQPSVALEAHFDGRAWLAVCCQADAQPMVHAALRAAYPSCSLRPAPRTVGPPPSLLRLKKKELFIERVKVLDRFAHEREPAMNRLLTVLGATGAPAFVQIALTPTPASFERRARRLYERREAKVSRQRGEGIVEPRKDRSLLADAELKGGLQVQHRPLFFADLRVIGPDRRTCERIASELRAQAAENRFLERGTAVRQGLLGLYTRRVRRGEGNPLPSTRKGVLASTELAAIWHMPSIEYATVPFERAQLPMAPAPPAIIRPPGGGGTLQDALGPVTLHPSMRRQNTAVTGTVEQGKSSYLVSTIVEDLRRPRCCVILLDPKGDAADAALSAVPVGRACTVLDLAHPTCGFNPLAVHAPADVIADYVVAAVKNLFTDADIRASSDRYLRNAIIAVLAYDSHSSLWDAARLLSVGEEGYAFRARVGARVRELPEFKEISEFFTAELSAQLSDARSTTTAKLDAPVNKLARLLNSASIKRVLLNESLRVDFDRVISAREVLIVKGALGGMGAGNTSVVMQLLVGMLDAALARQQDLVSGDRRVAVCLKVDEAPLVLNRGFAETMALKRSAGLETVACWQADAQWTEREVRDQLDALFAHRVCFATASVDDARSSARLMMAQFSDTVRPRIEHLSALGHPDARLHLPKHYAIASWSTPQGRQPPFLGETIALRVDERRIELHMARQAQRGGRYREDLSQPHWERRVMADEPSRRQAGPSMAASAENGMPAAQTRRTQHQPGTEHQPGTKQQPGIEQQRRTQQQRRPAHRGDASRQPPPPREPAPRAQVGCDGATVVQPPAGSGVPSQRRSHPGTPAGPPLGGLPARPAASFSELVEMDGAQSVRQARIAKTSAPARLEERDLQVLQSVGSFRHLLSSQAHRKIDPDRTISTTQRRIKRLADAGLIERSQFHRRDGGGVPMCLALTQAGLRVAGERELLAWVQGSHAEGTGAGKARTGTRSSALAAARRDIHAAAWVLALERALGAQLRVLLAPGSAISPPLRRSPDGQVALGPADLRLPGGRAAHDFLAILPTGAREPIERFETIRPQLVIEQPRAGSAQRRAGANDRGQAGTDSVAGDGRLWPGGDLMLELDDRCASPGWQAKICRYEHFLTGWSVHAPRRGLSDSFPPLLVVICRDRARARQCARAADRLLIACRAYAGEYPRDWEYTGRRQIVFVSERDMHEGILAGYQASGLPPQVRAADAGEDPRMLEPGIEIRQIAGVPADASHSSVYGCTTPSQQRRHGG